MTEKLTNNQESSSDTVQHEEKMSTEINQQSNSLSASAQNTEPSNTKINTIIMNSVCRPLPSCDDSNEVVYTESDLLLPHTSIQSTNTESTQSTGSLTSMLHVIRNHYSTYKIIAMLLLVILIFLGPIIYICFVYLTSSLKTYRNITY